MDISLRSMLWTKKIKEKYIINGSYILINTTHYDVSARAYSHILFYDTCYPQRNSTLMLNCLKKINILEEIWKLIKTDIL